MCGPPAHPAWTGHPQTALPPIKFPVTPVIIPSLSFLPTIPTNNLLGCGRPQAGSIYGYWDGYCGDGVR